MQNKPNHLKSKVSKSNDYGFRRVVILRIQDFRNTIQNHHGYSVVGASDN